MATQKLQVGRALSVIPSDGVDIPFPMTSAAGVASGGSATTLVDATASFLSGGVKIGDVVYNTSTFEAMLVISVDSNTQVTVATGTAGFAAGNNYTIYQGNNNEGCVLYIGTGGDLEIETTGRDQVVLLNVASGQFIPIQVMRVTTGTTATDILALW